eukprot:g59331.t1
MAKWSPQQVEAWATVTIGLDKEDGQTLLRNKIDRPVLLSMAQSDFLACGLPFGPSKKLAQAVQDVAAGNVGQISQESKKTVNEATKTVATDSADQGGTVAPGLLLHGRFAGGWQRLGWQFEKKKYRTRHGGFTPSLTTGFDVCDFSVVYVSTSHTPLVALVSLSPLLCYRDRAPLNYILFSLFTLAASVLIAIVCAQYYEKGAGEMILKAFVTTCSLFLLITLFVLQTKVQFSFLHAGIFAALWIISIWGFAAAVAGLQPGWWWADTTG